MKEKIKEFFNKLNNSYLVAAICALLIAVIFFGLMIGLVAHPFATNTTYTSSKISNDIIGDVRQKLVLLDDGNFQLTTKYMETKEVITDFGHYRYGKIVTGEDERLHNVIWLNVAGTSITSYIEPPIELKSPFKIEYNDVAYTNVGGILLLVLYCCIIAIAIAIGVYLILKRKDGAPAFTSKMRVIKRLKEIEEMLGVRHE